MFRIIIQGKTMIELRSNVVAYLAAMNDFTEASTERQDLKKIHVTLPLPAAPSPEPARSIPEFAQSRMNVPLPIPSASVPTVSPPSIAAAPVLSVSNDYGVDSRGLPWDERIHAVTQGKNKDGSWRNRRGVEPALIIKVEGELKSQGFVNVAQPGPALPPPVPVSPFGPPPTVPFIPQIVPPTVAPPTQSSPAPVTVAPTPTIPASVAPVISAHTFQTFKEHLVATLGRLVTEGKLTQEYVNQLKTYFKVEQIWQVNDEQCNEMFENFAANGLITKAQQ